jgi:hypothetical protein
MGVFPNENATARQFRDTQQQGKCSRDTVSDSQQKSHATVTQPGSPQNSHPSCFVHGGCPMRFYAIQIPTASSLPPALLAAVSLLLTRGMSCCVAYLLLNLISHNSSRVPWLRLSANPDSLLTRF